MEDDHRLTETREACRANDPPIEVNQRWVCFRESGEVFRRVRILAPHPDLDQNWGDRVWIYCDEPAGMRVSTGDIRTVPEFNLRYVFELEESDVGV